MENPEQVLIIIPDISGFSSFVNEVAISHSEHIIRELLEIIIEGNDIGLEVSEIEGDAVLFYKFENFPEPAAILKMVEDIFIRFHEHLQLYEQNRLCPCGACQTAHQLDIKFIVDQGYVKEMKVNNHTKLVGPAMIGAHRLLKNDVPLDEYLLLSERYVGYQQCLNMGDQFDWINWVKGSNEYEDIGTVHYQYTALSRLKKEVRQPEERKQAFSVPQPLILKETVNIDFRKAYQIIADSTQKPNWVKGVQKVIRDRADEIERIGSKHLCVINNMEMEFQAVDSQEKEDELYFMELIPKWGLLKNFGMMYRCRNLGRDQCQVIIELHYQTPSWLLKPIEFMALTIMKWQMRQSLQQLKRYVEN